MEQQFVVHLYAVLEAAPAFRQLWAECRKAFGLTEKVLDLPIEVPVSRGYPAGAEAALAGAGRGDCQAIVRVHHDVLVLSLGLTGGDWQTWDATWSAVVAHRDFLGEARLFLAHGGGLQSEPHWLGPVTTPDGLAIWERGGDVDYRRTRRFLIAFEDDPVASAFVWSRGTPEIPPLARYLLHAAKMRYELGVWLRDGGGRPIPGTFDAGRRIGDIRRMRHTVDIAADNMLRSFDLTALLLQGGPFADDAGLARSLTERLDDDLRYLHDSIDPAVVVPEVGGGRDVFVVHGRDLQARDAVFTLLRALDLRPLEWETLVARTGGHPWPYIGDVLLETMPHVQAIVVLMTPDDLVHLHPDFGPERQVSQARPNVLIELGMAFALRPKNLVVLTFGAMRPISDIDGRNFVTVADDVLFRTRLAHRLKLAGCPVDLSGGDWLTAGDFGGQESYRRGVGPHLP
ncbi:CATRA conflict system CASPASE/TPR repeat-associated protein [Herbidospora daliensis]|uniref:CATRA conflict system CASPASE/TPR repeat-associated protein n=1 Tax=Herbidospora daliensis TaxID=295585 RepID=UPI0012FA4E5E|nr:CATRA conflict system CASPASE/TPR repeat-associated protein [Herbidospora daliensis]